MRTTARTLATSSCAVRSAATSRTRSSSRLHRSATSPRSSSCRIRGTSPQAAHPPPAGPAAPGADDQSTATQEQWDAALARAQGWYEEVQDPNADWFEIAKESDDPGSRSRGGDLGWYDPTTGNFVPEFEAAIATLGVGEISEPVKTDFGYHVIQVTDQRASALDFATEPARGPAGRSRILRGPCHRRQRGLGNPERRRPPGLGHALRDRCHPRGGHLRPDRRRPDQRRAGHRWQPDLDLQAARLAGGPDRRRGAAGHHPQHRLRALVRHPSGRRPDLDRHPAHTGLGPGRLSGGSMTMPAAGLDRLLVAAGIDPASGVQAVAAERLASVPFDPALPLLVLADRAATRTKRPPFRGATRIRGRPRCWRRSIRRGTRCGRSPTVR